MLSNSIKGGLYGCIAAISYGLNPFCALSLYQDGMSPTCVLFYRFFIGSILLGLLMAVQKKGFEITRKEAGVLALLGILFAVSSFTYYVSFNYMGAGVAATLVFAYPVFTALLMAIFFKERLKWPSLLAIAMTIGGIILLYKDDSGKPIAFVGIVLILLSALSYALYIILINQSGIVMSSVKLTFYAMLSCLLCIIIYSIVFPEDGAIRMLSGTSQWGYAFLMGLVPTVVSLVFMAMAIRYIGSTPTAIMGALEPVTAIVLGMAVFGEHLTARLSTGVVLILISVILIILDHKIRHALTKIHIIRRGKSIVKRWIWK